MNQVDQKSLDKAVDILKNSGVVGIPTETVYGLGALISSEEGIKKIFEIKKRPFFDPLIVHVDGKDSAKKCFSSWNDIAEALADAFWPGPLTLVMPKSEIISDVITSGLLNVGVRVPNHPVALELIKKVGSAIAAPSANLFGKTSPTTSEHVRSEFNNSVYVLDSTPSQIGIESTVLLIKDESKLAILRKGFVLEAQINEVLKQKGLHYEWIEGVSKKESPGHMKHHYMPEIPFVVCKNPSITVNQLVLRVEESLSLLPAEVENVKIVKPNFPIKKVEFLKLSKDPVVAARELYSQLRQASQRKPDLLCFIQIPGAHQDPLWNSVLDRMYKAASLIIES